MDIRNVVSLSAGLLLLGGAGYFWGGFGKSPLAMPFANASGLPDYEIDGISALRTDAQGKISERLQARSLRHFPENDTAVVKAPILQMYRDGAARWELQADRALTRRNNDELELQGQVRGRSITGDLPVNLQTTSLLANRETQILSTSAAVTVRSGASELSSLGLTADIRREVLELPAQVRGTYVIPSRR